MIACVASQGVEKGQSALLTNTNGIPVIVTFARDLEMPKINVGVNIDHRVWDGTQAGLFYKELKRNFYKIIGEEDENTTSRQWG